jgi:diguanylate cyclase (GGDEF)-like protein
LELPRPPTTKAEPAARRTSRTTALLRERGQQLGCAALSLLSTSGSVHRIWARSRRSLEFGQTQFGTLRGQLLAKCIGQRDQVVSHRVRPAADAPVVAQVIAVPVGTRGQAPIGVLAAVWRPEDPAFDKSAILALRRLAIRLANSIPQDRDTSSGLLTWPGFCRRLDRHLADTAGTQQVAVLYGNIDRLHLFNNSQGMSAGDDAILLAALVIRRAMSGSHGLACRLSGDRFLIALPDKSADDARQLADRIREKFESESQRRFGAGTSLSISFGVSISPPDYRAIDQALTNAELACRAAKDRGRNRVDTFEDTDLSIVRRHDDIDAIRLLRDALDSDHLVIYAQPIAPLLNRELPVSYEFLVRIEAKDGRIAEPAEFMSAAARYQMLPMLDRAVVAKAFAQLRAAVPGDGRLPFGFSVNFAATTLGSPGIDDWVIEQLERYQIPGNQLTIELTESTAGASLDQLQSVIGKLARVGVRFAIDDFGTGVNSLSHIKALDVGTIKLDGSYVRDVSDNARSQALVKAVVQLADSMGVVTVAEYVDSIALRERLVKLGVHFAQGFAVGRPEPLADLLAPYTTPVATLRTA